ncbi:hypothetical protein CEXT_401361 [Caerostris extrusa]|uniref:Uncharacterized protein n=1 Tax=Caerostris extrusa TaxID=172846 RepID=A0AAV4PS16_CAEEX|nr:hypothetical protein CEXT_401361 [Caerostris extrusa]
MEPDLRLTNHLAFQEKENCYRKEPELDMVSHLVFELKTKTLNHNEEAGGTMAKPLQSSPSGLRVATFFKCPAPDAVPYRATSLPTRSKLEMQHGGS